MTLSQAHQRVSAALPPDQSYAIEATSWRHVRHDGSPEITLTWKIWDGSKEHEGPTLEFAVEAVENAWTKKSASLEEADKALAS